MKQEATLAPASIYSADLLSTGQNGDSGWKILRLMRQWTHRWTQRRHLEELDPRMLKDIGINPLDALQEARKPFWEE